MPRLVRPGDVIAVHIAGSLGFFARVEEVLPDVKKGWRNLRFLVLSPERQELTWTLEPDQIDGAPFTMGGTDIRIERLPDPAPTEPVEEIPKPTARKKAQARQTEARVIAFPAAPKSGREPQ